MRSRKQGTKEEALIILSKINDMIRGRNFAKMVLDKRYEQLRARLMLLGWRGLVKEMKIENREIHVQLRLVAAHHAQFGLRVREVVRLEADFACGCDSTDGRL